jgi:hypothetical protein
MPIRPSVAQVVQTSYAIIAINPRFLNTSNLTINKILYTCLLFLFWKNKCIYKNGLGNGHPALCSTVLYILFYHSGHPAIFEYIS